ncbi:MAG: patatin-like phospholipase family protein [Polyangiaceae bacterium]
MRPPPGRVALVLAGGAARGAYEVGVVQHVLENVSRDLGHDVRFDILSGTSVGALNACGMAAFADLGPARMGRVVDVWTSLDIVELVRPDARGLLEMTTKLLRRSPVSVGENVGGLIDPTGLEELVHRTIPFDRIDANIRAGALSALTVSTTHVRTGRTVVYVQSSDPRVPTWRSDSTTRAVATTITARHALASAAIPILFRAVAIDNAFHSDGGLRQNVPLSPARRLGASRVFVVNPRCISAAPIVPDEPEQAPGLLFLLGKTLNALLLDRIESDLSRLGTINRILEAGTRAYGPDFIDVLNREMGRTEGGFYPMQNMLVRATEDIGRMAADFVRSPAFSRIGGMTGQLMRRLAERDAKSEADLLSYLLFDGEFARQLIELGRRDARARHEELCRFFAEPAP